MKKVRVICYDPYATESSDDERSDKPQGRKRFVREIILNQPIALEMESSGQDSKSRVRKAPKKRALSKVMEMESSGQVRNNGERKDYKKERVLPKSCKHIGVRYRKWGSWAAEISIRGRKVWLGTFSSAEAAAKAYKMKKLEIKAMDASVLELETSSSTASVSNVNSECNGTVKDYGIETDLGGGEDMTLGCRIETRDDAEKKMPNLGSQIGEGFGLGTELDSLFVDDFGNLLDDFGRLDDDLQVGEFEGDQPNDLPDFDFELGNEELAWVDEPINVVCPISLAASMN